MSAPSPPSMTAGTATSGSIRTESSPAPASTRIVPTDLAAIESAVRQVITAGLRTADIYTPGTVRVDTAGMGEAIAAAI